MRIAKLSRQQFAIITTALGRLFAEKEIIEEEERLRAASLATDLFDSGVHSADELSDELLKLCCALPDGLSRVSSGGT